MARRSRKSSDLAATSSSNVSIRLTVNGPSSWSGRPPCRRRCRGVELLAKFGVGRPVRVFEVLVGVEVIEVAPELVEAVPMRKMLFEIAEMVLAELCGCVAARLENFGKRDVFLLQTGGRAWRADCRQAGAHRELAGNEAARPAVQLGCA